MQDANQSLRRAFGSFMTGVTVVTTINTDGEPVGFTANSFTSVSMEPPLLLVCPGTQLQSFDVYESITHFAISILAEGQEAVSNTFASATDDRFAHVKWHKDTFGSPLIKNAAATFSCRVHQRHMAGDHMILVGEVLEFQHFERRGLGYSSTGYFSLSKEQQADKSSTINSIGISGAIIKSGNKVLVVRDGQSLTLPAVEQQDATGARSSIQNHFDQYNLEISLGPVYSIYDDTDNRRRYTYLLGAATVPGTVTATNDSYPGEFIDIDALNTDQFVDAAQTTMMQRFVTEVRSDVFGLYVGDTESGDVHHR